MKRIFSTDFRKILKHKVSRKSFPYEPSCSVWTDGQTDGHRDMTKLTIACHNFATA